MHRNSVLSSSQRVFAVWLCVLIFRIWVSGGQLTTPPPKDSFLLPMATEKQLACSSGNSSQDLPQSDSLCSCTSGSIQCSDRGLSSIPIIYDNGNDIIEMSFRLNSIERIENGDFVGLESLTSLDLGFNRISVIGPYAFRNLFQLLEIFLSGNNIGGFHVMTFQHLPKLRTLYLGANNIVRVNRYSFLTTGIRPETFFRVEFWGNPIHCDCDILALRSFRSNHPSLHMNNVSCDNDIQKRSFDTVETSVFGRCYDTDRVLGAGTKCLICEGERTNYQCNQNPFEICGELEVCRQTVHWDPLQRSFNISSRCENYNSCIAQEFMNSNQCCYDDDTSTTPVSYSFCCVNATCEEATIGGRTEDYSFNISYTRQDVPYAEWMGKRMSDQFISEQTRISEKIRPIFSDLVGGIDVYIAEIIPAVENAITSTTVVLRVETTVFNTDNGVLNTLAASLSQDIPDPDGFSQGENVFGGVVDVVPIPKVQCLEEYILSEKGMTTWPTSYAPSLVSVPCPHHIGNVIMNATRRCNLNSEGLGVWGLVDDTLCFRPTNNNAEEAEQILNEIENLDFENPEQAEEASELITELTTERTRYTPQHLSSTVGYLDQLATEDNFANENITRNVMDALNNLLEVDLEVLSVGQAYNGTSYRLLHIIDAVSVNAPLTDGQFKAVTPKLAVLAQEVMDNETQNILMSYGSSFGANNSLVDSQITIDMDNTTMASSDKDNSLLIPIPAILETMEEQDRRRLSRIAFVVYQSDILFQSMQTGNPNQGYQNHNIDVGISQAPKDADRSSLSTTNAITRINSHVLSASIPGVRVTGLPENVTITFEHDEQNSSNPTCVYWVENSTSSGDWSSEGCVVVNSTDGKTTCGCNHLTNFALLMDVYQEGSRLSRIHREVLSAISFVGCGISLCALTLTLITYIFFGQVSTYAMSDGAAKTRRKSKRDNPSKILINLCVSLILSNLTFVVLMHDFMFDHTATCKMVAVLLHYFLLAAMCWMAVEAFYMYLALIVVFKTYFTKFLLKCSLVGWGVPAVIVVITLAVDGSDNYGYLSSGLCWLKNPAFYIAFVAPVCLILTANCIVFGFVIRLLFQKSSVQLNKSERKNAVQRLRGAVGVLVLLGLTWLFAVFAIAEASVAVYYLFAIFNSLQGLFIFIFHCVLKKDVLITWKAFLPCFKDSDQLWTTGSRTPSCEPSKYSRKKDETSFSEQTASTKLTYSRGVSTLSEGSITDMEQKLTPYDDGDRTPWTSTSDDASIPLAHPSHPDYKTDKELLSHYSVGNGKSATFTSTSANRSFPAALSPDPEDFMPDKEPTSLYIAEEEKSSSTSTSSSENSSFTSDSSDPKTCKETLPYSIDDYRSTASTSVSAIKSVPQQFSPDPTYSTTGNGVIPSDPLENGKPITPASAEAAYYPNPAFEPVYSNINKEPKIPSTLTTAGRARTKLTLPLKFIPSQHKRQLHVAFADEAGYDNLALDLDSEKSSAVANDYVPSTFPPRSVTIAEKSVPSYSFEDDRIISSTPTSSEPPYAVISEVLTPTYYLEKSMPTSLTPTFTDKTVADIRIEPTYRTKIDEKQRSSYSFEDGRYTSSASTSSDPPYSTISEVQAPLKENMPIPTFTDHTVADIPPIPTYSTRTYQKQTPSYSFEDGRPTSSKSTSSDPQYSTISEVQASNNSLKENMPIPTFTDHTVADIPPIPTYSTRTYRKQTPSYSFEDGRPTSSKSTSSDPLYSTIGEVLDELPEYSLEDSMPISSTATSTNKTATDIRLELKYNTRTDQEETPSYLFEDELLAPSEQTLANVSGQTVFFEEPIYSEVKKPKIKPIHGDDERQHITFTDTEDTVESAVHTEHLPISINAESTSKQRGQRLNTSFVGKDGNDDRGLGQDSTKDYTPLSMTTIFSTPENDSTSLRSNSESSSISSLSSSLSSSSNTAEGTFAYQNPLYNEVSDLTINAEKNTNHD